MCSPAEETARDNRQPPLPQDTIKNRRNSAPRRRKATLLPQIDQLSLAGHGCREIAARLGIGKSTVSRWLRELHLERRSNLTDATGMIANAVARFDSIYREAMQAWQDSKADKEVRLVEDTEGTGNGGGAKKKSSVRTERRVGDIDFLAQAHDAANAICKLVALKGGPITWDTLREEDIPNMCEAELHQVEDVLEEQLAVTEEEVTQLEEARNAQFS